MRSPLPFIAALAALLVAAPAAGAARTLYGSVSQSVAVKFWVLAPSAKRRR